MSQGAARRQGEARRLIGSRSTKANTPLHPPRSSYSERYKQKSQVEQVGMQYKRYWTFKEKIIGEIPQFFSIQGLSVDHPSPKFPSAD